ncbi:SDR family oxidoreductase [Frigidibacter sp. MR17.24]|uniref:SDR family oxidoreductase n=1 Tax=Frigidibacter sp. MR17.24 TaxID=3127345 RepID=UPI003012B5DA
MDLRNKVAVVTGGSSGIGLATAGAFIAAGAEVVITGRRQAALDRALKGLGPLAMAVACDSADPVQACALADRVRERFGGCDIFMANAGVNTITPSDRVSPAEYDAQFDVNTRGTFFGLQAMRPVLRDGASVILTGSIAASRRLDGHAVYAASKAALAAFVVAWVAELRERRIRVNLLSPGPVDTAILEKLGLAEADRPGFEAAMAAAIPAGRLGRPEEIAQAALFLASDASSFVNGIELRVDGGMSAV